MKKYVYLSILAIGFFTGCSTWQPATDEEYQQNMHDLDMYMLSHGMQPPNH